MPELADIKGFYEAHPYPPFQEDMDLHAAGVRRVVGSPKDWFHLYFPRRAFTEDLDILIAGCGMLQVGLLGLSARRARFTAIDVSRVAIEAARRTCEKYSMDHVDVRELPIEDVGELGRSFDLIFCTGVLHHLESPLIGLKALRSVLRPEGAMNLMVYGHYGRFGLEMMQELLRCAGVKATSEGIDKTRRWLDILPDGHPARDAVAGFRDLSDSAGMADLLLNPRERSYTVPDIYRWLDRADLRLQRFFYRSRYLPSRTRLRDTSLPARAEWLPAKQQHAVAEMIRCSLRKHHFVACRRDRPPESTRIDFGGDQWLDYVPIPNPGVRIADYPPEGVAAELFWPTYEAQDMRLRLDAASYRLYQSVDGRRTVRTIVDAASRGDKWQELMQRAKILFSTLWDSDFILFHTLGAYPKG